MQSKFFKKPFKKYYKKAFSLVEIGVVIIVILGLVSLINYGQKLITQNKIENAIEVSRNADITSIKSLMAWFETTNDQSFNIEEKEDFYPINNWLNLNKNLNFKLNLTQKNINLAPSYLLSFINKLPSIEFNGVNSFFELESEQELNLKEFSIFIVNSIKNFSPSDHSTIISSCGEDQKFFINAYRNHSNPNYQIVINDKTQIIDRPFNQTNNQFNKPNILYLSVNPAAINSFVNGLNILNLTNNTKFKLYNKTFIGANDCDNPTTNFFLGHISEIIIFNQELNDQDRQLVEKYLARKWAIKLENPQL